MIINLIQKTVGETKPKGPAASLTPASGVTYTEGLAGLDGATVSLFCGAISNNTAINNGTGSVYIDYENEHRKFSIGDQVTLALKSKNYVFNIIGFNHDDLTDAAVYGEETATGKAGMTLQMHDLYATVYSMNNDSTNNGGWKSCAMRTSRMATMKGYLPDDWEAIIKPVNKKAGTGGGSSSGTETVSDSCFLLSEIEVFGKTTNSVAGEGSQYAYYKAGNSKVKNDSDGYAYQWFARSPCSKTTDRFCMVGSGGTATYTYADYDGGVSFAFCV